MSVPEWHLLADRPMRLYLKLLSNSEPLPTPTLCTQSLNVHPFGSQKTKTSLDVFNLRSKRTQGRVKSWHKAEERTIIHWFQHAGMEGGGERNCCVGDKRDNRNQSVKTPKKKIKSAYQSHPVGTVYSWLHTPTQLSKWLRERTPTSRGGWCGEADGTLWGAIPLKTSCLHAHCAQRPYCK